MGERNMAEVTFGSFSKRLERVKKRKEQELALVENKLEAVRANQKCLEEALKYQNKSIKNIEHRIWSVDNNREMMLLKGEMRKIKSSIEHSGAMSAWYQEQLDFLDAQIDKGVKRVRREKYFISPSNLKPLFYLCQFVATVGIIIPTAQLGFNVFQFCGIVGTEILVSRLLGGIIATRTINSISSLEAKKIVQKRLQEEKDNLTKAREKSDEFPQLIVNTEKSLGRPTDDELAKAKQEKNEIERSLEAAKDEESELLEEKLRLAGGLETVEGLCEEMKPKEVPQERQKIRGPLIVRHPGQYRKSFDSKS